MAEDRHEVPTKTWAEIKLGEHWLRLDYEGLNNKVVALDIFTRLSENGIPARVRSQSMVTVTAAENEWLIELGDEKANLIESTEQLTRDLEEDCVTYADRPEVVAVLRNQIGLNDELVATLRGRVMHVFFVFLISFLGCFVSGLIGAGLVLWYIGKDFLR